MLPVGFEPTISAGERQQTYALDRAVTGTGIFHTSKTQSLLFTRDTRKIRAVKPGRQLHTSLPRNDITQDPGNVH